MTYHHGNARAALLAAAAELLETEGAARLSLRQVTDRAGLSRQAPYNHFADKEALLAELVQDGFQRLGNRIRDVRANLTPSARLAKAAEHYIAFGQDRPAMFRLMFSKELVDIKKYPIVQAAASSASAQMSVIIAALAPKAAISDLTLAAWSIVHGYTSLCVETGLEAKDQRRNRADLFARAIEALARSYANDSRA